MRTDDIAIIVGSARMLGGTIRIDGPVGGVLTLVCGEITRNTAVTKNILLQGGRVTSPGEARPTGREYQRCRSQKKAMWDQTPKG